MIQSTWPYPNLSDAKPRRTAIMATDSLNHEVSRSAPVGRPVDAKEQRDDGNVAMFAGMTTESWWLATAPGVRFPPLDRDLQVDVAVIGAGIAGISTAWELARSGRRVVVVEANEVAAGVTGHTTAKLTALHTLIYARLADMLGADSARLYAQSQLDAIQHVVQTAERLAIDCDLESRPAFTYSMSPEAIPGLRAEADAATRAGLSASFVTDTELPFEVAGAVRLDDQYQFHPRRYLLGLVTDMASQGVAIHEHTRVVALHEGQPGTLTTDRGHTITAEEVVVATHFPVFDRSLLFARLVPHRELVVAGPLPGDDIAGMYLTPDDNTRSVRTAPMPDHRRLLIVTGERFRPGTMSTGDGYAELSDWAGEHFSIDITHRWAAQDNDTSDGLPFIGTLHPFTNHVWVATGFGGWGMSNGVMAARLLAGRILDDQPPDWLGLYDPGRLSPRHEAVPIATAQARVINHLAGDRIRHLSGDLQQLGNGQGDVILHHGRHLAVHRRDDGELVALSARCTHLGCLVQFNDGEQTWECPCHGSRFALDGSVIQGPATKPLAQRPVSADPGA